jgi:Protein of unknown function (DUF3108)
MLKFFFIIPIIAVNMFYNSGKQKVVNQANFTSDKKIEVGEELDYVVKYAFFILGQIRIIVTGKFKYEGKTYYRAEAYIDSYEGIPFVDIHQVYKTIFPSDVYSSSFTGLVKYDSYSTFTQYNFNYDSSKVWIQKGKVFPHEVWTDSTAKINEKFQDGLSILYYARVNSGQTKSEDVPCFVKEKKEITKINFYNKVTDISIDAVDYPVACVKIDGEMNFVSIYGLTGGFEGWFSNDQDAVPIYAKMHVIVGNVTVELKEWKKKGWTPPKYEDN